MPQVPEILEDRITNDDLAQLKIQAADPKCTVASLYDWLRERKCRVNRTLIRRWKWRMEMTASHKPASVDDVVADLETTIGNCAGFFKIRSHANLQAARNESNSAQAETKQQKQETDHDQKASREMTSIVTATKCLVLALKELDQIKLDRAQREKEAAKRDFSQDDGLEAAQKLLRRTRNMLNVVYVPPEFTNDLTLADFDVDDPKVLDEDFDPAEIERIRKTLDAKLPAFGPDRGQTEIPTDPEEFDRLLPPENTDSPELN